MKRLLVHVAVLGMLSGCALNTTPQSFENSTPVPDARIRSFSASDAGTFELLVKLDPGGLGLCYEELSVDGKVAAYIGAGEKVRLFLKSGQHAAAIRPVAKDTLESGAFSCTAPLLEYPLIVSDGTTRYRMSVDDAGRLHFGPTATN